MSDGSITNWRILLENRCGSVSESYIDHYVNVLNMVDSRLLPNVHQWLNHQPIEDIWIGKYCIGAVMSIHGDEDFLGALEAMDTYIKDEKKGIQMIWRMKK